MTKRIPDIRIIDVKKSTVDVEKTKERGRQIFAKKVYYKFRDNTGLSPYWFYWGPKMDPARLNWLQSAQNYEFVTKDDPYLPEGVILNAEKQYQFGDLVLMKCPLTEYIERRVEARRRADAQVKSRASQFSEDIMKDGGQALTEEQLNDLLGK